MKITILSLFKDVFNDYLNSSIIKRAIINKHIDIEIIDFREYANNKNKQVDDYQYGGGPGMVLMIEPIVNAIRKNGFNDAHKILLSPKGKTLNQKLLHKLKTKKHLVLICGHYEGFDERINHYIDETISIGDYILTGGELAALVIVDAISRLLDGVIKKDSLINESFNNYLLDYPVYTKPINFENHSVPNVLLSGNHQKIKEYRMKEQIKLTRKNRPDLYRKYKKEGNNE